MINRSHRLRSVKKNRLSILGCTGSIGRNALQIAAMYPDRFEITVLAAANNIELLTDQIRQFRPEFAVVLNPERASLLKKALISPESSEKNNFSDSDRDRSESEVDRPECLYGESVYVSENYSVNVVWGDEGYALAASHENTDTVLLAMVGAAGLKPALTAIDSGKHIALANKETLVMAGELVMERASSKGVQIFPVDSEHSAIFQCIEGNREKDIKKIFLTASGGPFRTARIEDFVSITPEDALNHPTWNMGSKITIDSATLMNKALEIVEAVRLFKVSFSDIEVVVHPQSVVHSMVGFSDGSILAQLGIPDMKVAISYALSWPERLDLGLDFPDFTKLGSLSFEAPDREKFPSLRFAEIACREGGTLPAVMNAANEIAVNAFLNGDTDFPGIFTIIEKTMSLHKNSVVSTDTRSYTIEDVIMADIWARETAASLIQSAN